MGREEDMDAIQDQLADSAQPDDFVKLHEFDRQLKIIANTPVSFAQRLDMVAKLLAEYDD